MVMGFALAVWGVPALYYHYPIRLPLSNPLPLKPGTSLRQQFTTRGSQRYEILLRCVEVGAFKEQWKDFLNWKTPPSIPCDINLRILRGDQEIHSAHLRSLRPAWLSGEQAFWSLAYSMPLSSGTYELQITNQADLTELKATEPTVQIRLNAIFIKDWGFNALLGFVAGVSLFLVGLAIFAFGLLLGRRPANPPAGVGGGTCAKLQLGPTRPAATQQGRWPKAPGR